MVKIIIVVILSILARKSMQSIRVKESDGGSKNS